MFKKINQIEPYIFYSLLLVWLTPVWLVDYFVTGDGPCHFYNSKILLDWFDPALRTFYKPYYFLNTNFDPNWLYNLITTPLLMLLGPSMAEKVFFTGYVIGFALGFRYLVTKINYDAKFISTLALLFCYHKLLMMGFLNNSLSLAIWFWVVGWWWSHRDDNSISTLLKLGLIILLLFSAHPMGFTYAGMMIICMLTGLLLVEGQQKGIRESWRLFLSRSKNLVLSALPALILFGEFVFRRDWTGEKTLPNTQAILTGVAKLTSLRTMQSTEQDLATATAVACTVFFLFAILLRLRQRRFLPTDGLLVFVGLSFYSIINPPSNISGGLEVPLRMGMIPFFGMISWSATATFPAWSKFLAQLTAIILVGGFLNTRLPIHRNASDYAKEIRSCAPFIKDTSKLLTLNYDWTGHTPQGNAIANDIWMFTHVDCYLGTDRSVIISDNYETHFWYFPIVARWQTDMYGQTDKDGINFDNRPPRADILSYGRRTRTKDLDYILMLGSTQEFKDHEYTKEINSQLNEAYDKVFTSQFGRAVLYKRRGI